jgi:apolipoprotein N-acyltransferase
VIQLILSAVISSALYVFSFAPWSSNTPILSQLQWLAFVPLLFALYQKELSYKKTFLLGYIISLGITVGGFYWIIYATQQYGGLPWIAAFGLFILFCLIAQLQVPLYFILRKKALERISLKQWVLLSGLLYAGIESFYPKLFLDTAGNAFADSLIISQLADIGGVFTITTLVVTFAESLVYAVRENKKFFWLPLSILLFSFGYGNYRVNQITSMMDSQKDVPSLKVSIIQGNIGDYMKVAAEQGLSGASDQVMNEYLKYSGEALRESPDALVWPETAYSTLFGNPQRPDERRMEDRLREFSHQYPGMMIFGGYDQDAEHFDYNSLFFLPSSESLSHNRVPTYHKNILLMFGETLPFADFFPSMKSWFPTMGFFGRGPGPEVYSVPNLKGNVFKLAPSICYEGLFSDFTSAGAELGADAIINVTNDSWFGPDGEPYLHFALTRFRTIETRLPMIRSTNTGISAFLDPLGRITKKTNLFEAATLTSEIKPHLEIMSPYQKMAGVFSGHWYERLTQLILFSLIFWIWKKRKTA